MDRSREHQRRWNTGQLLRSLDESQLSRSRSVAHSSSNGRTLVSRLGMTEVSCFPSSRSRRASAASGGGGGGNLSTPHRRSNHASRIGPDRGKAIHVINNELAEDNDHDHHRQVAANFSDDDDDDEQVFDLSSLLDRPKVAAAGIGSSSSLRRSLSAKRKSSSFSRGSSSSSSPGKAKAETIEGDLLLRNQRDRILQRSSTFSEDHHHHQQQQQQRPKISRRGDAAASSSRSSRDSAAASYDRLLNATSPFTRTPAAADTRGRTRSYDPRSSAETLPRNPAAAAAAAAGLNPDPSRYPRRATADSIREASSSSSNHGFGKRNIANCFGSGRRSPSPRPLGGRYERASRRLAPPSSAPAEAPPASLLSAALEAAAAASSSSSQAGQPPADGGDASVPVWSSGGAAGWEYHRPRLMAEGLAKILLALERVENDEELTHELLMLEATVLFGGMGLHDRHSDWRMDVDHMSYEELLALEEKIGDVNTGLSAVSITHGLRKCRFSTRLSHGGHDEELKCSICQEEYKNGDQLGRIDCGHKFHVSCIKQWLAHKNLCPICKSTALSSP